MSKLILVRHGESTWNAKGLWTGLVDVPLSERGKEEARQAAEAIKDLPIDTTFTSPLKRAKETLDEMKKIFLPNLLNPSQTESAALNERDYGAYTGKNKWEIKETMGEETFRKIRRGWDYPIPGGEALKDVYNRVVPYYQERIEPLLRDGRNVLIVAHGNSIRALVKYLENISDNDIENLELATGEIYLYDIGRKGRVIKKEIRLSRPNTA